MRARPPLARLALVGAVAFALGGCAGGGSALRGSIQPPTPGAVVLAWPAHGAAAAAPRNRETVHVMQSKGSFVPARVIVTAGSTIEFENHDRVWHNAFSVSPQNRFDLGRYADGDVRRVTVDQPGIVEVFCELHPKESMQVVVVPGGWRAKPGADGRFTLDGLPKGSYVVRAWHPTAGEASATVEVPGGAPTVLRLRPAPASSAARAAN